MNVKAISGAEAVLAKALAGQRLVFINSSDRISTDGPVIITIGTPIDEFLNPVRRVVQDCIDAMLACAETGCDIVCASRFMAGGSMVGCLNNFNRQRDNPLQ